MLTPTVIEILKIILAMIIGIGGYEVIQTKQEKLNEGALCIEKSATASQTGALLDVTGLTDTKFGDSATVSKKSKGTK